MAEGRGLISNLLWAALRSSTGSWRLHRTSAHWRTARNCACCSTRSARPGKPFGSVEVAIRTKAGDETGEGTYKGRYAVTVHDMRATPPAKASLRPSMVSSPAPLIDAAEDEAALLMIPDRRGGRALARASEENFLLVGEAGGQHHAVVVATWTPRSTSPSQPFRNSLLL